MSAQKKYLDDNGVKYLVNKLPGRIDSTKNTDTHGEVFNDYIDNEAIGKYSHVEGRHTIAENCSQHSQGQYNTKEVNSSAKIYNSTKTLFVIGNGTSNSNRSDAFKMLGNGTTWISGIGDFNGKNPTIDNSLQAVLNNMIWMGTQQEYDAITIKNPKTLYLIQK